MKNNIIICMAFAGAVLIGGCSKSNELVPPNKSVIRDYVLPPAPIMTPAERVVIDDRREEYNSIL